MINCVYMLKQFESCSHIGILSRIETLVCTHNNQNNGCYCGKKRWIYRIEMEIIRNTTCVHVSWTVRYYKQRTHHEGHATIAAQVSPIPIAIIWNSWKQCLPERNAMRSRTFDNFIGMTSQYNSMHNLISCLIRWCDRWKIKLAFVIVLTYNSLSSTISITRLVPV